MSTPNAMRVALVTGGAQGVGLGIATALAEAGWKVALTDLAGATAAEQSRAFHDRGLEARGFALDVTREDAWSQTLHEVDSQWGKLDLLVNNAGISPRGTAESTTEELWDRTMATNVKGAWLGIKSALPWLKKSKGSIVNIGSNLSTRPARDLCAYCSSKAALYGLTRQVALDYLDHGVKCNLIAPGWVDTPGERIIQAGLGLPDWPEGLQNITTPADAGAAVLFLMSPAGRRIHGSILYLDSGQDIADDVARVYKPDPT